VIKLYDYQVGSKFLSFRGSREALNENLVETILPFRLLDFRQKPDPKRTGDRAEGEFQGRSFRTSFRSFRDRLLNHRPRGTLPPPNEPRTASASLTQVSMTRGGTTQTRTFTYDSGTQRLTQATTPEAGTVRSKRAAKGAQNRTLARSATWSCWGIRAS
jgi:hypothetical protein